jgi:hypothetical protein
MPAAPPFTPLEDRAIALVLAPLRLPPPAELAARRRRGQASILLAARLAGQGAACLILDPPELAAALQPGEAESLGGLCTMAGHRLGLRGLLRAAVADRDAAPRLLLALRRAPRPGEAPPLRRLGLVRPEGRLRVALLALPGRGLLNLLA